MRLAPRHPLLRLSACLCAVLLGTPPVYAHDDEHDDAPADAPVNPAGVEGAPAGPASEPQTVVVRVKAHPWSASDTVIDRRQLDAAPRRNGSELLREVPGVYISQHGGEGKAQQIFFRGFDADHGQDVEMWAGGAPVNEVSNIHGQGYADLYFLIPEVVEEIHSQPGTYDPRQGDFAVAGSLGFRLGYAEPGMTLKASAGNFGTRRYLLAYHPEGADSQTFGAFELYATDGFGPSRAAQRASGIAQWTHDFGGSVTVRALATTYSGRFDSAGVVRLDDVESGRIGRFDTYDSKQGGSSSRTSLVLELGREREPESANGVGAPDGWSIAPYLVLRSLSLRSNFTGYLVHPTTGDSVQQVNEATTVGARAAYHRTLKLFSAHDTLEAGVMLRTDWIRQSQHWLSLIDDSITDSPAHPGVAAKVRATDATGYFTADLHLIRRLSLRGGLRADGLFYQTEDAGGGGQVRSAQGGQLSKRATLDWAAHPGLHALASYGDGFRSPQARSLSNGETTPFTRVASMEAGVRYADRQRLSASAAVYHTRLSDDLVFDQATARNELVPSTSRTGIALLLSARPTPWLLSSTNLTTTHAVFTESGGSYTEGDLLPYVPQVVVQSELAVTPELGRLGVHPVTSKLGGGLAYLGQRPMPYSEMGHDVLTLDATAALRWGPVAAQFDVFNLLDAEYYDGEFVYASSWHGEASLVPARHVSVGAPRSWLFTLSLFV